MADDHMESQMRDLFADEYEEEPTDECTYIVNSIEVLDENNEHWEFYNDPLQHSFYPEI